MCDTPRATRRNSPARSMQINPTNGKLIRVAERYLILFRNIPVYVSWGKYNFAWDQPRITLNEHRGCCIFRLLYIIYILYFNVCVCRNYFIQFLLLIIYKCTKHDKFNWSLWNCIYTYKQWQNWQQFRKENSQCVLTREYVERTNFIDTRHDVLIVTNAPSEFFLEKTVAMHER